MVLADPSRIVAVNAGHLSGHCGALGVSLIGWLSFDDSDAPRAGPDLQVEFLQALPSNPKGFFVRRCVDDRGIDEAGITCDRVHAIDSHDVPQRRLSMRFHRRSSTTSERLLTYRLAFTLHSGVESPCGGYWLTQADMP